MSRISCVLSSTRQGSAASRLRSCVGDKSWSNSTRSASAEAATPAISSTLPDPISVAGSGLARRCSSSATTTPPALVTSSRNSASDSSASRPAELGACPPTNTDGVLFTSSFREESDSGSGASGCGTTPRPPDKPARLAPERTPRSTPTRTARSALVPVPAALCPSPANRGRSLCAIAIPHSSGMPTELPPVPLGRPRRLHPDDAPYASRFGCSPRSKWRV